MTTIQEKTGIGPKISSKLYSKSLKPIYEILVRFHRGETQAMIARELGRSESDISYLVDRAEDLGYVRLKIKSNIRIYELTQPGQKFIGSYSARLFVPQLRAERVCFRAYVIEMPERPVNWVRIQMQNWGQYHTNVGNVKVRLNDAKTPTIEFYPGPLDGNDVFKMRFALQYDCEMAKAEFAAEICIKGRRHGLADCV